MPEPVGFDLETADASQLFKLKGDFVRIGGYTDGDSGVGFTTDMAELIRRLNEAPWIYGHGIDTFDLITLAHAYGADWEALTKKAIDTEISDRLDYPPMARDTGGSVDRYDLDHVAARRGVAGKAGNLAEIAAKHGGYASIPNDDAEYLDYLRGDVNAIRGIVGQLPIRGNAYAKREHQIASLNGRMTLNGFRVDVPLLEERISQGEESKREALLILRDDYDLPLGRFEWSGKGDAKLEEWAEFDSPLTTLEGRRWLVSVWQAFGVRNPPITETGRASISAEDLRPIAESGVIHPDLRQILNLMIIVTTTRTIYQTIQDHMVGDRVHPLIVMRQASGRSSVTSPGLTVMGKRGPRLVREREVLLPNEGDVLISADMRQADMRAVAGYSQDPEYMKLFGFDEDGKPRDPHREYAIMFFNDPGRRAEIKPVLHGANYGRGRLALIAAGHDPAVVDKFFEMERERFPVKEGWKAQIQEIAASGELLDNGFGRLMRPDPRRAFTQGPALMGQGGAADLLKEAMLRLSDDYRPWLELMVHDELLISVPEKDAKEAARGLKRAMTFEWRDVPILCDVSEPGKNWGEVSAK